MFALEEQHLVNTFNLINPKYVVKTFAFYR